MTINAGDKTFVNDTLATIQCCNCGVMFAIPEDLQRRLRNNHRDFYCPNGHPQRYNGPTEADKLREELKWKERLLASERSRSDQLSADRDHHANRANGYKGQLARQKNRIKHGVCPCCNRTFEDLRKHMASEHPSYVGEDGDEHPTTEKTCTKCCKSKPLDEFSKNKKTDDGKQYWCRQCFRDYRESKA